MTTQTDVLNQQLVVLQDQQKLTADQATLRNLQIAVQITNVQNQLATAATAAAASATTSVPASAPS